MSKTLFAVLLLAAGIAVAQQPSNPSNTPPPDQPATAQPETPTAPAQSQPSTMSASSGNTFRGCISGSDGNFMLKDDSGNSFQLTGNTSGLKEHVGHTVEISGSPGTASGTLNIDSFKHIADNCRISSAVAPSTALAPATEAQKQPSTSMETGAVATGAAATGAVAAGTATTTPPVSSETPAATKEEKSAIVAQPPASTEAAPAEQKAEPAQMAENQGEKLPQTASPLPLLGLLGLGSLVGGMISRRKK